MAFDLDNYEPVSVRIAKFYDAHPDGRIITDLVHYLPDVAVFRADIYVGDTLVATGWEEETRGSSPVNRTSHLANCETSAVGRALANYNLAGSDPTKRPSREEMAKVNRATKLAAVPNREVAPVQIKGKAHGPIPAWMVKAAADAGVEWVWDNRDQIAANPTRPHFKNVNGDDAFWPPKDAPQGEEPF
jgi:hypothetical protein